MITPFVPPALDAPVQDHALALVQSGFQCVLLHAPSGSGCTCGQSDCVAKRAVGKHPIRGSWQKTPPQTVEEVLDEFRKCKIPNPNLGIVLGVQPFGAYVLAIDIDDNERFSELRAELGDLPDTLMGKSARGLRLFYTVADPPKTLRNVTGLGEKPGVDVKVKGGLVVVAPSRHASGVQYTWLATPSALAEIPSTWLLKIAERKLSVVQPEVGYRSASKIERGTRERASSYLDTMEPSISGSFGHDKLMRAATAMVRGFELDEVTALSLLQNGFNSRCQPAWSPREILHKIKEAERVGDMEWGALKNKRLERKRSEPDSIPAPVTGRVTPEGITADQTDLRNAERLVEWYGHELRFCSSWKKWLAWDGTRWTIEGTAKAHQCAKETARRLLKLANEAHAAASDRMAKAVETESLTDEAEAKKALAKARKEVGHAIQTQSASRIMAMISVAQSDPAIVVHHDGLDVDPWVLNVQNGTIELKTGQLRGHRRDDMITKLAPVMYDANAQAPTWDAYILQAMGGSFGLVEFLHRLLGYALTGVVLEHVLVFFHGEGRNGKGTFVRTIHAMLGDYAIQAPRHLLFRSRGERHPTELTTLYRARFVSCSEIEDGMAFDEALVKDLTGGDRLSARRMKEDFWGFDPTHTLFLSGNHKPIVRGDDNGIWRRIRLVPWTVTISRDKDDKQLSMKLRDELPGILATAVRGGIAYLAAGLAEPSEVGKATEDYRRESDLLAQWLATHAVFEPTARVPRADLREQYEAYCSENGAEPLGARKFAAKLRSNGASEGSMRMSVLKTDAFPAGQKVVNAWKGVRLATQEERDRRLVAEESVGSR